MRHASVPCIIDGGRTIRIRGSIGLVHTNNSKIVAIIQEALEIANVSSLGNINADSCKGNSNSYKKNNKLEHLF
jgi:hypothetical protein